MKLDRTRNLGGLGKYSLILNRKVAELQSNEVTAMLNRLEELGVIETGTSMDEAFFVVKVKDKYAGPTLRKYAEEARADDPEYALEVDVLAANAESHPGKKLPD